MTTFVQRVSWWPQRYCHAGHEEKYMGTAGRQERSNALNLQYSLGCSVFVQAGRSHIQLHLFEGRGARRLQTPIAWRARLSPASTSICLKAGTLAKVKIQCPGMFRIPKSSVLVLDLICFERDTRPNIHKNPARHRSN